MTYYCCSIFCDIYEICKWSLAFLFGYEKAHLLQNPFSTFEKLYHICLVPPSLCFPFLHRNHFCQENSESVIHIVNLILIFYLLFAESSIQWHLRKRIFLLNSKLTTKIKTQKPKCPENKQMTQIKLKETYEAHFPKLLFLSIIYLLTM